MQLTAMAFVHCTKEKLQTACHKFHSNYLIYPGRTKYKMKRSDCSLNWKSGPRYQSEQTEMSQVGACTTHGTL